MPVIRSMKSIQTVDSGKSMKCFYRSKPWVVYLPIIAAPMLLFGVPLLSGKVLYWGTAALQFVPWRALAFIQLDQGVLPLWNPLNGMGAPLIANYQLGFFYPPGWLTILGHWLAGTPGVAWMYTLLVPIHLVWAGIGMAVLLRSLGVKPLGQMIAGIGFGMCGYFVARASFFSMIWTGVWMPWVLWAASGIASPFSQKSTTKRYLWMVIICSMMLLAGHAQLSWYILLFSGIWVVVGACSYAGIKKALVSGFIYLGLVLIAFLLAGIQLIPTLEYLLESQRAAEYEYALAMTYSFWPWRLLTFLNADMFGNPGLGDYWGYAAYWEDAVYLGVIPLLLALGTIKCLFTRAKEQNKNGILFLWVMALIGLIFAVGANTPIYPFLFKHVPSFNLFQAPARWMLWPVTSMCLLAGISSDRWRKPHGNVVRSARLGAAGFVAVLIGAGLASLMLPGLKPGLMRGFMIFAGLGMAFCILFLTMPAEESSKRPLWVSIVVLIVSCDLVSANLFSNPYISSNFYRSDEFNVESLVRIGSRIFISSKDEYDLKFNKYLRFSDTRNTLEFSDVRKSQIPNLNLLDGIDSANNFDPFVPARYDTWMQAVNAIPADERDPYLAFMGVDTVIQQNDSGDSEIKSLTIDKEEIIEVFTCMQPVSNAQEALNATLNKIHAGDNSEQCIIIEASDVLMAVRYAGKAEISAFEKDYKHIKFRIDSNSPIWLRIGITWYPGWHVKIDGIKTPATHADYIFSGVYLSEGSHEVIYYYQPVSLWIGVGMTVVGMIVTIFFGWYGIRRHSRQANKNTTKPLE